MKKIRFKLLSRCDNKLQVVKLIKDCTGLGLKDSKDIADLMFNNVGLVREIELTEPYIRDGKVFNPYQEFTNKIILNSLFNKLKKEDLVELVNQIKI